MRSKAVPKNRENVPEKPKRPPKQRKTKIENEPIQRFRPKTRPASVGKPSRLANRFPKKTPYQSVVDTKTTKGFLQQWLHCWPAGPNEALVVIGRFSLSVKHLRLPLIRNTVLLTNLF